MFWALVADIRLWNATKNQLAKIASRWQNGFTNPKKKA
jgi:hypothetical protein